MYTPITTIALGIFIVISVLVSYLIFQKLKIKIDKYLLLGILPWVLFLAILRVLEDAKYFPETYFTVSPGIILLGLLPIIIIVAIFRKYPDIWKILFTIGLALSIVFATKIQIVNYLGFSAIVGLTVLIGGILLLFNKYVKTDILTVAALHTHLFDASATFISMSYFGYSEQHVVPTALINTFGPAVMFPLKLATIIPILYLINKYSEDEPLRKFLIISVLVLGLAPALRDLLRLAMGV